MSRIKILFTIPNFDTAGSGKVLYDLVNGMDKSIFEIHIACNHNKGSFFKEIEKLGLPIHFINFTTHLKPYSSLFIRLYKFKSFLKKNKFEIVHSWNWSSDWTEVLSTRWAGSKFIYTKKAMSWGNKHWKIKSFLSSFIITINEEMKSYFPYKKNQMLIPLGIDTDFYNPDLFKRKEKKDEFKIVTIANLVPVKGIEILINAVSFLKKENLKLEIIGDTRDPYANDLKDLIKKLNLKNQVSILGKHEDVRPFLLNADLFVIPTLNQGRKEGMPMALVEAMSMAVPVLGSNISGINFVLKDFPNLLFEAGNTKELATKINQIVDTPIQELNIIGENLRGYCLKHFTLNKFIIAHENLYLNIVKKRKNISSSF